MKPSIEKVVDICPGCAALFPSFVVIEIPLMSWAITPVTSTADIISPSTGISINLLSAVGLIIIFELILNIKHYFYCPLCI